VVEIMAERVSPETVSVGDVMSYDLATAREDEGIWEVIRRMRAKGVRRLPIVDEAGALVGIVTMDDMLEFLTDEFYGLVKLLARQREREQETRARP
jgi:CBS domain-containing protein